MGLFNKKELQRISELEQQNTKLQKIIDDLGASDIIKIKNHITELKNEYELEKSKFENNLADYSKKIENLKKSINALNSEVNSKRSELFDISEEINLQDF